MLSVRKLCFAGALLAVAPFAVFAAEQKVDAPVPPPAVKEAPKAEPKAMPTPPGTAAPAPAVVTAPGVGCPPATAPCPPVGKQCVLVPTQVQETRTVMKPVQKTETYTAYKYETVQEKKVIDVTTYKHETYTENVTRTTCVKVPVWEEKCVMETRKRIEWVTEYKEKCKVNFVKDCKTFSLGGHGCGLGGLCGGHGHCGNPCDTGCGDKCGGFSLSIPTIKPCVTTECVPVCRPKCVTECVPVMKKCCTYRTEYKTECVPVCKTRCVPCVEKKEITCCKQVCVPYQATRCVTVCEPVCETVTVCKMVPTMVDCPAPAAPACHNPCDNPCGPAAAAPACHNPCDNACGNNACHGDACGGHGCGLFSKFKGCFNFGSCFSHKSIPTCNTGCNTGCDTGCHKSHSGFGGCHINLCNPCGFLTKFKGCCN